MEEVVIFDGVVLHDDIYFLVFLHDLKRVEVPVDHYTAERIMKFLGRILPPVPKIVERGNDKEGE